MQIRVPSHDASRPRLCIRALSTSCSLKQRLIHQPFQGRVLSAFPTVCNLVGFDASLVSVVSQQVGNGPLNLVLPEPPGGLADLVPGMDVHQAAHSLCVGSTEIAFGGAVEWEARPDWEWCRARFERVQSRLPRLLNAALERASVHSLLHLLRPTHPHPRHDELLRRCLGVRVIQGAQDLQQGWLHDPTTVSRGAAQLAGAGGGLTPAGDDFLVGVMLSAWLAHPEPQRLCQSVLAGAQERTTALSQALLRTAAAGECGAVWHDLFFELASSHANLGGPAVRRVLAQGSTSGADALAGFLWMHVRPQPE